MKLTAKREAFCQAVASGKSQADAYRIAYEAEKSADKTIWENASRLSADSNVKARIAELKAAVAEKQLWTRQDSVRALADIAMGEDTKAGEKVAAVKELNAMHGFNEAQKHELSLTLPRVINVIAGRA